MTTSSYQLQSTTRFVYDGWNLIAELDSNNALTKSYIWGQDVSGQLQDAGGIGGLLFINANVNSYQTGYDGNGSLTLLVKASNGIATAIYDYNPFGETLQENGEASQINPFRFSTKYTDLETNLIYYGYRYYNPQTGRWISKDPIGEDGGINLYAFAFNNPVSFMDALGQKSFSDYAVEKMLELYANRGNEVGSKWAERNPTRVGGRPRTDCITYIGHVLVYAYTKIGRKDLADRIPSYKEYGTNMARFLTEQGWKAHYFNKDTDLPPDKDDPNPNYSHGDAYKLARARGFYSRHRVPLSGGILNYKKDYNKTRTEWHWVRGLPIPVINPGYPIRVTISNETREAFNRFTQVKFAVLIAKQGLHTMMVSYGNVYEVHWEAERDNLYGSKPMIDMEWHSGIVVVPPDLSFDSDPIR